MSENFYTDANFLNVIYATDIAIENYIAEVLFDNDLNRIIYSSNAYAFRKRSDQNQGNINLPFVNYKITDVQPKGDKSRWNASSYLTGMYISELQAKIKFSPLELSYESTFWVHKWEDLIYATDKLMEQADIKTRIVPIIQIGSEQLSLTGILNLNIGFNPSYTEQDWLDRNKISSIAMNFSVDIFRVQTNYNITLVEDVVFEFASNHGYVNNSYDETVSLVVDHLTKTVE